MLKDKLRLGLIVGAIVGVVGALFTYCRPAFVENLEGESYNVRARWSANPSQADPRIVMVDVDQGDLEWMEQHVNVPSWPWPRYLFGMATKHLLDRGALAVSFDLLFEDRSSSGPSDDERFGAVLGSAPRTVVGLRLSRFKRFERKKGRHAALVKRFDDCAKARPVALGLFRYNARVFLIPAKKPGCDLWIGGEFDPKSLRTRLKQLKEREQFTDLLKGVTLFRELTAEEEKSELRANELVTRHAALSLTLGKSIPAPRYRYLIDPQLPIGLNARLGVVSQSSDSDGIFRRYAPLMKHKGSAYPSLALATAMVAFPKRTLRVQDGRVSLGDVTIPRGGGGRVSIRYHGSGETYARVGIRHIINVVAQQKKLESYLLRRDDALKGLRERILDEQRLPKEISRTLKTLWVKLQKDDCGIRTDHKRLAILKQYEADTVWHTLRAQWATEVLAQTRAKHGSCSVAASMALNTIKALRTKFNGNAKQIKIEVKNALGLKYPKACSAAARTALDQISKITGAKKAQPQKALEAFQTWLRVVKSPGCKHNLAEVINDTLRKELLKQDLKHKERFARFPGLKPGAVKGRIFIVHAAAAGLRDIKPSAVDPHHLGGEITANFLDNLLHGDFIRRSPPWVAALVALLLCLLLSLGTFLVSAITRSAAWVSVLSFGISALVVSFYGLFAFQLYKGSGVWLDLVSPTAWALTAWAGAVATNFYQEGKSRRFVQDALGRYTAPALVKELMANPQALTLGWGDKRELSVFFSDLQGFTSISERLTAEQLVHLLNEYLTEMTDIILHSGGIVDKYIGDAIMAFWGAPYDDPEHAMNACRATVKMQNRLKELQPKWQREYGEFVTMRCGINTGQAVAGTMGSKHKFNYTLMGDTVNLASRFEGANKPYATMTMIGAATREVVNDRVVTRELDFMAVKGKSRPVRVYELMGLVEDVDEKAKALSERFDQALDVYRQTKFKEALGLFQAIIDDYDGDGPSKLYIARCREYLRNPPPLDWDGVYRMTTK